MKTKRLALCALFAALTAICAWICVPVFDIAFTMQTFAIFLALFLLDGKWGTVTILVYLLMGAVGLPVFSGFQGGFGVLLGVTGGYAWGFLVSGLVYWGISAVSGKKPDFFAAVIAMLVCYLCGTVWYLIAYAGSASLWAVVLKCVVPYLIPDAAKLWLAYSLSIRLRKIL